MVAVLCLGLGQGVTVRKLAKVQEATVTSQEQLLCTRHKTREQEESCGEMGGDHLGNVEQSC